MKILQQPTARESAGQAHLSMGGQSSVLEVEIWRDHLSDSVYYVTILKHTPMVVI